MREKSEKELFIIDNYLNMTQVEMAKLLDMSPGTVEYYLRKNNLKKKLQFSDYDIEFMKNHYLDMKYSEIAEILGYTERQIRGKINNMGLTKIRDVNDHYFDIIDTPLKSYFLGFIYADGWIIYNEDRSNYEFGMELQSQDKYILDKLNEELGGCNMMCHYNPKTVIIKNHIANKNHSDCLRVFSKNIVLGLMNNGIETNKTQKSIYPIVQEELFFDFLRGYIDGDGCYWKRGNNYYMHITCANDSILTYIQEKLLSYNITTHVYQENFRKYRLICTNIQSMKSLVSLLYPTENVFCLSRKYKKIKSYLTGSAA